TTQRSPRHWQPCTLASGMLSPANTRPVQKTAHSKPSGERPSLHTKSNPRLQKIRHMRQATPPIAKRTILKRCTAQNLPLDKSAKKQAAKLEKRASRKVEMRPQ